MKKTLILCGLLLAVSAAPAMAVGVNLNWSDCAAAGLNPNATFLCNTNTGGAVTMIGSYVAAAHIDSMCANEIVLDLASNPPNPLPLWWNFQTGGCRAGSLIRAFGGFPFTCTDHWGGNVALSGQTYTPGFSGPNTARITLVAAVGSQFCDGPSDTGIDQDVEYYSFSLTVNRAKTVGVGACAGCLDPVSVVLNEIKLQSPSRGTTPVQVSLTSPDLQNCVSWQGGSLNGCQATPTRNRTWGAVKTLYR